jgi:hypothetical protein
MKIIYIFLLYMLFLLSCGRNKDYNSEYNSLMKQGYNKINNTIKIEGEFDSVSYIVNLGQPATPPQWRTKFFISGWYECDYNQEFQIINDALVLKGDPELYIKEIVELNGRDRSYGKQVILRGDELTEFIQTGFDLEALGFSTSEKKSPPPIDLIQYHRELHPHRQIRSK